MILINSSPKDTAKIFSAFYPTHPPIGIGYLLNAAEREGIKAKYIDEQVEKNISGLAAEYVKEIERPYIFGFSVLTAAVKNATSISRELKKRYPDSFIVFGGVHPTVAPEEILSYMHIDVILRGEAETTLPELYRCVKQGRDFTHIEALSYRLDGKIVHNVLKPIQSGTDSYPPFPYHFFNHKKYDMGFVMSSRGCPHKCIFCSCRSITGTTIRYRPAETIVDELEMIYNKYNKNCVTFIDDNFVVNKERVYPLIELIKQRGLHNKMSFAFQARGDNVEYNICKDMYDAGFRVVLFGLETASEKIMKIIKKGETVAQCINAVKTVKKLGFNVGATFVFGLPGDTHKERMNCLRLTKELQLDVVRYNNAIPYPGTELYEIAKKENRLNIQGLYENFIAVSGIAENPFKQIPLAYVPEGNTENEIRRDILISYLSTYSNIVKTLKIILKPAHGVKWLSVGDSPLETLKKMPAIFCLGILLICKFGQFIYYSLIKKETALPLEYLMKQLR